MAKPNITIFTVVGFLLGIFMVGFLPNTLPFLVIKLLVILTLTAGIYWGPPGFISNNKSASGGGQDDSDQETSPPFLSPISDIPKINPEKHVEKDFDLFLETIFPLIKQSIVCKTVVLCLINYYRKKFFLRYKTTEFKTLFIKEDFFNLNQGLPSLILKEKKALLENNLPDINKLLPYYTAEMPAKSFLGVPLYFNDYIIGVLCIDSDVQSCFSQDDLNLLTDFSKLLEIQLESSNKLFEAETENRTTRLLYDFNKNILSIQTTQQLWEYINSCCKKIFKADRIAISEKVADNMGIISCVLEEAETLEEGLKFSDTEGLIGWVLRKNQALMVDNFDSKKNYIPRFYTKESPDNLFQSLLAVPILRNDSVQAVISLESKKSHHFKEHHKRILETMAYQISAALAKIDIIIRFNKLNQIDSRTKLENVNALKRELLNEVKRSREFKRTFCLQLLKISTDSEQLAVEISDKLLNEFLEFIFPLFPPSARLFQFSQNTFAILWPEKIVQEVLNNTQKIFYKTAQKRAWADGVIEKTFLNSGIAQFPEMGQRISEILMNVQSTLDEAVSKGFNKTEVFTAKQPENTSQ